MSQDMPEDVTERICGLCGQEATGYASVWSERLGETWFCHGDEDDEPTCYERGQAGYMALRDDHPNAAIDLSGAVGDGLLVFQTSWHTKAES